MTQERAAAAWSSSPGRPPLVSPQWSQAPRVGPDLFFNVSMTRDPRPRRVHSRDYLYVTRDEFQSNIDSDLMLEWAEIPRLQLSGTPRKPVEEAMAAQHPVLMRWISRVRGT